MSQDEPKTEYTHEELAIKRRKLALEYQKDLKELGKIQQRKAFEIIKLRMDVKSDRQAERLFAITKDGQRELELNFKTRGILELIRSIKSEIDIKNAEAYNQY